MKKLSEILKKVPWWAYAIMLIRVFYPSLSFSVYSFGFLPSNILTSSYWLFSILFISTSYQKIGVGKPKINLLILLFLFCEVFPLIASEFMFRKFHNNLFVFLVDSFLHFALWCYLFNTYSAVTTTNKIESNVNKEIEKEDKEVDYTDLLGNGAEQIDKVIRSIKQRAYNSKQRMQLSLVIMVLLVLVGGMMSIGTILLDDIHRLNGIEKERELLNDIIYTIDSHYKNVIPDYKNQKIAKILRDSNNPSFSFITSDGTLETNINEQKNFESAAERIKDELGDDKTYATLLKDINSQSAIKWPDITVRIAIASLTLFLVQIFFSIYKYHQQQSSNLFTQIEVMELYKNSNGQDESELKKVLLDKLEGNPKFGKSPTSPTEQIIKILEKGK